MNILIFLFFVIFPFVWLPLAVRMPQQGYEYYKIFFLVICAVCFIIAAMWIINTDELNIQEDTYQGKSGNIPIDISKGWNIELESFEGSTDLSGCRDQLPADNKTKEMPYKDNMPLRWDMNNHSQLCLLQIQKTIAAPINDGHYTLTTVLTSNLVIPEMDVSIDGHTQTIFEASAEIPIDEHTKIINFDSSGKNITIDYTGIIVVNENIPINWTITPTLTYLVLEHVERKTLVIAEPEDLIIFVNVLSMLYIGIGIVFGFFALSEIFRAMYDVKGSFKL